MANTNMLTTGRMPHQINVTFIDTFLPYVLGKTPHAQFAKKVKMPKKAGTKVKWSRLSPPTAQTTPLLEDSDPNPILPTRTDLEAEVAEYGAQMHKSKWLDLTEINGENAEIMDWMMKGSALTIDELYKQMLATTATTLTASSGATYGGSATLMNKTDLDTAIQTLMNQDAEPITNKIYGSPKVGSTGLNECYIGIMNTALWSVAKEMSGWRDAITYGDRTSLYEGELGASSGGRIRWIGTTRGYVSNSTYRCPIIARNAYGGVKIPGGDEVLGFKSAENAGSDMNRYSVVYWLLNQACRILDDLNIITFICTAT